MFTSDPSTSLTQKRVFFQKPPSWSVEPGSLGSSNQERRWQRSILGDVVVSSEVAATQTSALVYCQVGGLDVCEIELNIAEYLHLVVLLVLGLNCSEEGENRFTSVSVCSHRQTASFQLLEKNHFD